MRNKLAVAFLPVWRLFRYVDLAQHHAEEGVVGFEFDPDPLSVPFVFLSRVGFPEDVKVVGVPVQPFAVERTLTLNSLN